MTVKFFLAIFLLDNCLLDNNLGVRIVNKSYFVFKHGLYNIIPDK